MNIPRSASVALAFAAAVCVVACGHSARADSGSSMDCSTYNKGNTSGDQYTANSNAMFALLSAHGVNPAGNHHYNAAAGDYVMNISEATFEIDSYCAAHPDSTIDKGVQWSNFGAHGP
jgi:hypothetical protein